MSYSSNYKDSSSKIYGVATMAVLTYRGIEHEKETRDLGFSEKHNNFMKLEKRLLKAYLRFRRLISGKHIYLTSNES